MQLRYLKEIKLSKAEKTKQTNGAYIENYQEIKPYKVQIENLEDQVSATVYGSDIIKMLRLKSPKADLEKYLIPKLNNKEDNISKYYIFVDDVQYKIKSVNMSKIDIERL